MEDAEVRLEELPVFLLVPMADVVARTGKQKSQSSHKIVVSRKFNTNSALLSTAAVENLYITLHQKAVSAIVVVTLPHLPWQITKKQWSVRKCL